MIGMLTLVTLVLSADPGTSAATPPEKVRETVAQGLAFLEKEGVIWVTKNPLMNCSSCHHVPMMLWSQHAAQLRGLKINEVARDTVRAFMFQEQLSSAAKAIPNKGVGQEVIYLSLALGADPLLDAANAKTLDKFKSYLLDNQVSNGSWKIAKNPLSPTAKTPAPIEDTEDVTMSWALLALSSGSNSRIDPQVIQRSQEKALGWLRQTTPSDSNQSLVVRLLVEQRFGKAEDVQRHVKQLLSEQREDGGWGQVKELPSDALATGQALYALAAVGTDEATAAVERARAFLVQTQNKDGSWLVKTRIANHRDKIITYDGTGWAVLGLIQQMSK